MRQETLLEQEDNAAPSAEKAPQHTPASESDNEVNEKQTDKELDDDETDQRQDPTPFHLESVRTQPDVEATRTCTKGSSIHRELTRTSTAPYTQERFDIVSREIAERLYNNGLFKFICMKNEQTQTDKKRQTTIA